MHIQPLGAFLMHVFTLEQMLAYQGRTAQQYEGLTRSLCWRTGRKSAGGPVQSVLWFAYSGDVTGNGTILEVGWRTLEIGNVVRRNRSKIFPRGKLVISSLWSVKCVFRNNLELRISSRQSKIRVKYLSAVTSVDFEFFRNRQLMICLISTKNAYSFEVFLGLFPFN